MATQPLRSHQEEALEKLDNGKILRGGVGSGKSRVAVEYYLRKEAPKDVYVITTAKKRNSLDWETEFARAGVGKQPDATRHGVLTVDSWNNIAKYSKIRGAFFIFDEQRLVGSGQWADAFIKMAKSNTWILLSATPGDTWMDFVPVFIANGFYKNRTEFKRQHVVYNTFAKFPKIDRYVGTGTLLRLRERILVEMPFVRHTTRHHHKIDVEFDVGLWRRVTVDRWNPYKNQPLRDVAELFSVMRRVVNSDASRLSAVRTLMAAHPRLIVFYNYNYELMLLRSLATDATVVEWSTGTTLPGSKMTMEKSGSTRREDSGSGSSTSTVAGLQDLKSRSSGTTLEITTSLPNTLGSSEMPPKPASSSCSTRTVIPIAEWNGHRHQPIPDTESWLYLVQYTAGAEGWNCTATDAMCFYSLPYSWKIWEQGHGRIDRLNTLFTDLHYYRLMSESVIDRIIWDSLEKKRNFNEKRYSGILRQGV